MHRFHVTALAISLALALLASASLAQQGTTLSAATAPEWGTFLVDRAGMSVYLYERDEPGALACVDACVNNWPPVVADGDVSVGDGLDPELVGSVERPDGTMQLTYGGHPLYTYARDSEAGDTNGQGLGGAFFLVAPGGTSITERAPLERVDMDAALYEELMTIGESTYAAQCAVCHAADGAGQIGPSLRENDLLGNTEFLAGRILNGFPEHGMPPFRSQLTDKEIAAVATFVRNSWNNDFGGVFEEEVSDLR